MTRASIRETQSRVPIPDVNRRAVAAGVVVKILLGAAVTVSTGNPSHISDVGLVAGFVTSLALPLGAMSMSSRLIDSVVEGSIASMVGYVALTPLVVGLYLTILPELFPGTGDTVLYTIALAVPNIGIRFLISAATGFIGGLLGAVIYTLAERTIKATVGRTGLLE